MRYYSEKSRRRKAVARKSRKIGRGSQGILCSLLSLCVRVGKGALAQNPKKEKCESCKAGCVSEPDTCNWFWIFAAV